MNPHLKLHLDGAALVANWINLARLSGGAERCGAAIKADAYGLGAKDVVRRLQEAGCQNFFTATWEEAEEILPLAGDAMLSVLNGVLDEDMAAAGRVPVKPVLNSIAQAQRWRGSGRPCDIMINSGMNRLGIDVEDALAFDWQGFDVDILMSHLASADEDVPQNLAQLERFKTIIGTVPHKRLSLANSAGVGLGKAYRFDLTRPGLSLYGGIPRPELADHISPVGRIETQLLQVRSLSAGQPVGYNATFHTPRAMTVGIAALGYADGYLRSFSKRGICYHERNALPLLGRVSMDLIAVDLSNTAQLKEGDWIGIPLDLPLLSSQSDLSQYEIITGLGRRFTRYWHN